MERVGCQSGVLGNPLRHSKARARGPSDVESEGIGQLLLETRTSENWFWLQYSRI